MSDEKAPETPDTETPDLQDQTPDDVAGEGDETPEVSAPERRRRLGPYDGTAAPYGLLAKRAAKRAGREYVEAEAGADEGYDPGAHTVAEVTAYLDSNPDQAEYVLDRERAGKARVTLIGA